MVLELFGTEFKDKLFEELIFKYQSNGRSQT